MSIFVLRPGVPATVVLKVIVINQIDAVTRRENIVRQFARRDADFQFLNAMHADDGLSGLLGDSSYTQQQKE